MPAHFELHDSRPDEQAIRSLSEQSGVSLGEVRALVGDEFARLKMGAKVGAYVGVLTASSVRGMLRRRARSATDFPQPAPTPSVTKKEPALTAHSEGDPFLS